MISVFEEISALKAREDQLHQSLDNLRAQRSKAQEHKQLDKELAQLIRKRQSLESLARFEIGMPVHRADSRSLGKVTEIVINPGGLGQVWVSWDGKIQIPEQPELLQPDNDALAEIIQVGDRIVIGKSHAAKGKTFTVARLLARGWVESTSEDVFPRSDWTKVESPEIAQEKQVEVIKPQIEMVEKLPQEETEELPKTIVTVETLAALHQGIEELTEEEEKERHRLELKVERAFREAGTALRELRDKRLYRSTHKSWEAYCKERFGYGRDSADLKISAAAVVEEIEKLPTIRRQILPTTLEQVRPLIKLQDLEARTSAWQQAVEEAGGKVPSGRIVKDIVQRLKEKPLTLASDFCSIGDVFTLTRLEGVERKYNGYWAIANDLRDFTVVVEVHDATLTVRSENLQPIDSPDARLQLPETLRRIRRLRNVGSLDRGAGIMLAHLGRQIYLTDFEDKLLTFMEQEYGIID